MLTFNSRYDTGIFSWEGRRVQLSGCHLGLAFTGARPAESEIFNVMKSISHEEYEVSGKHSRLLEEISQEYEGRGRPRGALLRGHSADGRMPSGNQRGPSSCTPDLRTTKGVDNKPKPAIFFISAVEADLLFHQHHRQPRGARRRVCRIELHQRHKSPPGKEAGTGQASFLAVERGTTRATCFP